MSLKKNPELVVAFHLSLIILAGVLAYLPSFQVPFVFDDHRNIVNNTAIRDIRDIVAIWNYNPSRFIIFLTFAVNYALGGLNPWGFHLVNLAIHVTNACLVYFLTGFLLSAAKESKTRDPSSPYRTLCLWAGLVFVSHPLQTQAVTFIWQRNASLSALFYVLSLVLYVRAALDRTQAGQSHRFMLVASWLTTVMAMFCKQNTFTLPLAILIIEFTFFTPVREWRTAMRRLLPFLATLCIVPFLAFALHNPELRDVRMIEQCVLSPGAYFLTQLHVVRSYLRLFFVPINQNLDYDYPPTHTLNMTTLLSFFLLTAVLIFGLTQFKRRKLVFYGVVFFFLALAVESSFMALEDLIYEHRLYLPMTGLILAIAALVFPTSAAVVWNRRTILLFLFIPCLALATVNRNRVWLSRESLWRDVIRKSPQKPRGYNNLGQFYQEEGQHERSGRYFHKMLELDPFYHYEAHFHLGWGYQEQGNLSSAREHYEQSLNLNPAQPKALYNLGLTYYDAGSFQSAANFFQQALRFTPDNVNCRYQMAACYYFMGAFDRAAVDLNDCLKIDPNALECHFLLGLTLLSQEQYEKSIVALKRVLELDAGQGRAHFFLARAYLKLNAFDRSKTELEAAKRLGFEIPEDLRSEFGE
jgi:tetratricopeptide (TPR) repeat protein